MKDENDGKRSSEIPVQVLHRRPGGKYLETLRPAEVLPILDSEAMILLAEIKAILDDGGMDDSQCLRRIDALVSAFQVRGIQTDRHDW